MADELGGELAEPSPSGDVFPFDGSAAGKVTKMSGQDAPGDSSRKKRCSDRYDSSESSDSGVAVRCGDCGSSNSDITEPCSPLSTTSLEEMPPTQNHPTWIWEKESPRSDYFKGEAKLEPSDDSLLDPGSDSTGPLPSPQRTIRFPPNGFKHHSVLDYVCRWTDCRANYTSSSALIEHLQVKHVNTQSLGEYYVCLWVDCKVFSRKSCSRTWLERHVLSHGGNKPYRCIVDGCGQRFSSQNLLQRHVNSHFGDGTSGQSSSKKSCESSNKLIRRNGKKLRYRRHPFSARIYDFFDAGIMEGVQHSLIEVTERRTLGNVDTPTGQTLTLKSKVICKRLEPNGQTKLLLRWYPPNIVDDEWVDSDNFLRKKEVNIPSLPTDSKDHLFELLSSNTLSERHNPWRSSRKPNGHVS